MAKLGLSDLGSTVRSAGRLGEVSDDKSASSGDELMAAAPLAAAIPNEPEPDGAAPLVVGSASEASAAEASEAAGGEESGEQPVTARRVAARRSVRRTAGRRMSRRSLARQSSSRTDSRLGTLRAENRRLRASLARLVESFGELEEYQELQGRPQLRFRSQLEFSPRVAELIDSAGSHPAKIFVEELRARLVNKMLPFLSITETKELDSALDGALAKAGALLKSTGIGLASVAGGVLQGAAKYAGAAQMTATAQVSLKYAAFGFGAAEGERLTRRQVILRAEAVFLGLAWQLAENQNFMLRGGEAMSERDIALQAESFARRVASVIEGDYFSALNPDINETVRLLFEEVLSKRHDISLARKLLRERELEQDSRYQGYILGNVFYIPREVGASEQYKISFVVYDQSARMPDHMVSISGSDLRTLMADRLLFSLLARFRQAKTYINVVFDEAVNKRLQAYSSYLLDQMKITELMKPHAAIAYKELIESLYQFFKAREDDLLLTSQERRSADWCSLWCCAAQGVHLVLPDPEKKKVQNLKRS